MVERVEMYPDTSDITNELEQLMGLVSVGRL